MAMTRVAVLALCLLAAVAGAEFSPSINADDQGNVEFLFAAGSAVTFRAGDCPSGGSGGGTGGGAPIPVNDIADKDWVNSQLDGLKTWTTQQLTVPDQDCVYEWTPWEGCPHHMECYSTDTAPMGKRYPIITKQPTGNGQACPGVESQACDSMPCFKPKTCREILEKDPFSADGVYTVYPDGVEPFKVYCDQSRLGGGWTLIGKMASGNFQALSDEEFFQLIANPDEDVNPTYLRDGSDPLPTRFSFFNKAKTDALGKASFTPGGVSPIVRVDVVKNDICGGCLGSFGMQKMATEAEFSVFDVIRDGRKWGAGTAGDQVTGLGTAFRITGNLEKIVAHKNTIPHDNCDDSTFHFWADGTQVVNGKTITMSKHFGLLNDGWCGKGNFWTVTIFTGDTRFKNDADRRHIIWVR